MVLTNPKDIEVVGAAIVRNGKVLCAQRGAGKSLAGYWEFPGGKIEPHETPQEALRREIQEELRCTVDVGRKICVSRQSYDFGTIRLITFLCQLMEGIPQLTEHQRIQWLAPANILSLNWAPADRDAVSHVAAMKFQEMRQKYDG